MSDGKGEVWALYQEVADQFARDRVGLVGEQAYLDRLLERLGPGRAVLDMGCGSGVPIARYLIGRGCAVTGIDAAPRMIEICRERFPDMTWLVQDMRRPVLGRRFDAIIAWDSFFHLAADDQRGMFDVFARLAAPGGLLLFTSGPQAGEAIGDLYGHALYHDSLSPQAYRRLLGERGFEVLVYRAEDPDCGWHTVWLAQSRTPEGCPPRSTEQSRQSKKRRSPAFARSAGRMIRIGFAAPPLGRRLTFRDFAMSNKDQAASPLYETYSRAPLAFERGEGVWLYATDGTRYMDFMGGIAVNVLGHAHPHVVDALKTQADKLWHVSNIFRIPGQEALGRRLVDATFADCVFFGNSGAEAMECAIKTARRYHFVNGAPERFRIITFEGAFHGRTLATLAAGGQEKYLEGFGPKAEGFDQVKLGDHKALEAAIGPETAAILIEPIQGEGGIREVPVAELRYLRELCDKHGLLLVLDEIQSGMGRTGKFLAHEWAGIAPDIVALAKGLGAGFPVGACLATREAASGMTIGTHGTTFGGNPLAMAVGQAVLDVILADGFLERVRQAGLRLKQKLAAVADSHPDMVEAIRGEGLMLGVKCRVPNADVVAAARGEGLLLVPAGENVARLLPPLIIEDAEVDEALDRLDKALTSLAERNAAA